MDPHTEITIKKARQYLLSVKLYQATEHPTDEWIMKNDYIDMNNYIEKHGRSGKKYPKSIYSKDDKYYLQAAKRIVSK